jgi:hypothetical protein
MLDRYCIKFLFAVPQYLQDFPVFHSQQPEFTDVGVSRLVAADHAIALYLQLRRRLKQENPQPQRAALASPAGSVVNEAWSPYPDDIRALRMGARGPVPPFTAWFYACCTFPLLVPSVIASALLRARDALYSRRALTKEPTPAANAAASSETDSRIAV